MKEENDVIDHIFIFCDNHDEVAEELIAFGFVEESSLMLEFDDTRTGKMKRFSSVTLSVKY